MAFTTVKAYGHQNNAGHREFVCDAESDIANLPLDCEMGSTAIVIEGSMQYIMNSKHEWKKLNNIIISGGSGSDSGSGDSSGAVEGEWREL